MKSSLQRYYSSIRERNARILEERRRALEAENPHLAALSQERGQVMMRLAEGKLSTAQAQSRIAAISAERRNLLIGMGHAANYLDPIYTCAKCKDTGEIGTVLKRPCSCQLLQLQKEMADGARVNDRETFARFDASVYPTETQRKFGQKCKAFCEKYVEELPYPKKRNLLFVGDPGTGKSFFGNAIGYGAIERGIETRKVTAYRFVQDALDGIGAERESMTLYTNIPLLILDDLGTEPIIPNITKESLFRVLNERIATRLATVVITNLPSESLSERYGERITSRLVDQTVTSLLVFRGENLRVR